MAMRSDDGRWCEWVKNVLLPLASAIFIQWGHWLSYSMLFVDVASMIVFFWLCLTNAQFILYCSCADKGGPSQESLLPSQVQAGPTNCSREIKEVWFRNDNCRCCLRNASAKHLPDCETLHISARYFTKKKRGLSWIAAPLEELGHCLSLPVLPFLNLLKC